MRSNNFLIYSFKLLLLFKIDKIFYTNVITILISYNTLKTSRLIVPALNTFLALFIRYSFYSFSLPFILRSCFDIKKSRNQVSRNLQRKSNMRNKKVAKDKISAICTNKKCKYHANVTIKGIVRIWKARTSYTWSFQATLIVLWIVAYNHVGKTGFFFLFHFLHKICGKYAHNILRPMKYSLFYFVPMFATGRNETDSNRRLLVHTCNSS